MIKQYQLLPTETHNIDQCLITFFLSRTERETLGGAIVTKEERSERSYKSGLATMVPMKSRPASLLQTRGNEVGRQKLSLDGEKVSQRYRAAGNDTIISR
jgi:hypothetical protein